MKQNYDNYFRKYYQDHKEEIYERTKKYKTNYNKEYYQKNREKINLRRKLKRAGLNKIDKEDTKQEVPSNDSP